MDPRSVEAAAQANVPRYFDGPTLLQLDLSSGPANAIDPAQAISMRKLEDSSDASPCLLGGVGGILAAGGSCGTGPSCGAGASFSAHGSPRGAAAGTSANFYGNSGW
jgi:hypothetical protein